VSWCSRGYFPPALSNRYAAHRSVFVPRAKITVAVAGASGSVGSAVALALLRSDEFQLVAASSRRLVGRDIGEVLQMPRAGVTIVASVREALEVQPEVFIDYTHPSVVWDHCTAAIARKSNVVVGTSGLTRAQLDELGKLGEQAGVGVFAAGNFSVTAALLQHLAKIAARFLPHREIVDYGKPLYIQGPSATGRELADTLASVKTNEQIVPPESVLGQKEARGATVSGTQVHSVRTNGFGFSLEAIFGLKSERLTLRHDCSESPEPYVSGTLLAAKAVRTFKGLRRGIDSLLFSETK
jgi:4-hydroxy-tetrahydrodipicolinate reductase